MGGSNARVGRSDFLVVESDESDGSFLKLAPILAVVTNIDREHLDHYATLDDIRAAFIEFVNKVPFYGAAISAWTTITCKAFCRPSGAAPSLMARAPKPFSKPAKLLAAPFRAISACAIGRSIWGAFICACPAGTTC